MAVVSVWRRRSRRVIHAALAEGRELGLRGVDLERHVSKAYPFGERAHYPYQCWLKEFNSIVRGPIMTKSALSDTREAKRMGAGDLFDRIREYQALKPATPHDEERAKYLREEIEAELQKQGGHVDINGVRYKMRGEKVAMELPW